MGVVIIVTSVLLFLAVTTLAVLLILLWRSHVHLRKDTDAAVDQVYDDMDHAIADLEKRQSQSITTKVVSAATVKIGDSRISHTAPKDEKLQPPPVPPPPAAKPEAKPAAKPAATVEKFESAPKEDQWIHMTDASGKNYHPGGLAAATAWLRDGMTMPGGTCISEVSAPGTIGGGRLCMGGKDGADALNLVGRGQATQPAGPRMVRVQDALSFSTDGKTVMAMMPASKASKEKLLTVSTIKAMQDGSYLTSKPSEMGHLMVAGGLATTQGVFIGNPDTFAKSSILSDATQKPTTVMRGAQGVWETTVDADGSWALTGSTMQSRPAALLRAVGNKGVGVMLPNGAQPGEALDVNGTVRASGKLCIGSTCLTSDDIAALKQMRTQPSPAKVATDVATTVSKQVADQQQQKIMQSLQQTQQQAQQQLLQAQQQTQKQLTQAQQQMTQAQQQYQTQSQQQYMQLQQQLQGFGNSLKQDEAQHKLMQQQLEQSRLQQQQQQTQFQQQLQGFGSSLKQQSDQNLQQHAQFQQQLQGLGGSLKQDEALWKQQSDQNLQQHAQFQQQLQGLGGSLKQQSDQSAMFLQQMQGMSPQPIFGSLGAATVNAAVVVFGTKLFRKEYTGPVVRVRRGSDNAVQDFYATPTGTITTAANGAGTPYSMWIGSGTGYVTTWYDQSGRGSHITQGATNMQPVLTSAGKLVFNGTSQFLQKPFNKDVNTQTFTYIVGCTCYNVNGTHQSPITSRGAAVGTTSGYTLYKHPSPDNGFNHWNGAGGGWQSMKCGMTCAPNTVYNISGQYNGSTMTTTVNGTVATANMQIVLNTTGPFRVGAGATEIPAGMFFWNGEVSAVMYFNTAISSNDRNTILVNM